MDICVSYDHDCSTFFVFRIFTENVSRKKAMFLAHQTNSLFLLTNRRWEKSIQRSKVVQRSFTHVVIKAIDHPCTFCTCGPVHVGVAWFLHAGLPNKKSIPLCGACD